MRVKIMVEATEIALNPARPEKRSRLERGTEIDLLPAVAHKLMQAGEALALGRGGGILRPTAIEVRSVADSKGAAEPFAPKSRGARKD